jgi:hypothetical protein
MRHDQHLSSGGGAWCSQRRGGKPQGESRARWPMSFGARCGQRGAVPQRSREPASPCPQTFWARGHTCAWWMGWRISHAPERSAPRFRESRAPAAPPAPPRPAQDEAPGRRARLLQRRAAVALGWRGAATDQVAEALSPTEAEGQWVFLQRSKRLGHVLLDVLGCGTCRAGGVSGST